MTEKQYNDYLEEMSNLTGPWDHDIADSILCDILEDLGYHEIVEKFCKLEKWYS